MKINKVYPEFEKKIISGNNYRKIIISTNVRIKRGKKYYFVVVEVSAFIAEGYSDKFISTDISNTVDLFKRFLNMCEEVKYLHSMPSKWLLEAHPDSYSKDSSHLTNKETFLLNHGRGIV